MSGLQSDVAGASTPASRPSSPMGTTSPVGEAACSPIRAVAADRGHDHVVKVDRAPGFCQAQCSCGWTGVIRVFEIKALRDARDHEAETKESAA